MPHVIGEVPAEAIRCPSMCRPALASAKIGMTTLLVHGWTRFSSRSLGEIELRARGGPLGS
jgi:hypothetical protein